MWQYDERRQYMERFAMSELERIRLLEYNDVMFKPCTQARKLPDESFVDKWKPALGKGGESVLALLDGLFPEMKPELTSPPQLGLFDGPAGAIPTLYFHERSDFEGFVLAIFRSAGLRTVAPSVGAMTIRGLKDCSGERHRIILVSRGFYSAVQPDALGIAPDEWRDKSRVIREFHEYTHYYTLRRLSSMRNHLHDELIADCMGLLGAFGHYSSAMFQRFVGVGDYPAFTSGGRLLQYMPSGITEGSPGFKALCDMAYAASLCMESKLRSFKLAEGNFALIDKLAAIPVEQLAAGDFEL